MISYYNTINEIEESGVDTAIIPIGSIEQHGSHLPIGMDYFSADALSKGLAEKLNALLYPTIPFSTCYEHKGSKGSLCMRPTTFYQMLQDLVLNLHNQGFKKVIVLITHGGVHVAAPAIRELNALHDDLQVVLLMGVVNDKMRAVLDNKSGEIHAGEKETSLMLYIDKDTVNQEEMLKNDCIPPYPQDFMNYASILKLSKNGVWGKPSKASEEKGKLLFEYYIEEAIDYIKRAFEVATVEKWQ